MKGNTQLTRNARGIDLLAYDTAATRYLGFQVKALSKRDPVPLGNSIDRFMGDWWIVVTKIITSPNPHCFILQPDEVRQHAHRGEKDGRISYWLQPNKYHTEEYFEAWHRIGRGDVKEVRP
jgi:hypothetical protein